MVQLTMLCLLKTRETSKQGNVCIRMGASSKSSNVVFELVFSFLNMLNSKASMFTSSSLLTFRRGVGSRSAN